MTCLAEDKSSSEPIVVNGDSVEYYQDKKLVVGTGNVGVRTTLGVIAPDEVTPGVYMKWPVISTVQEFTGKEIAIDLQDLTPKAKDNLSLQDMDVTVYYKAKAASIRSAVAAFR